jgi:hypothetical protein
MLYLARMMCGSELIHYHHHTLFRQHSASSPRRTSNADDVYSLLPALLDLTSCCVGPLWTSATAGAWMSARGFSRHLGPTSTTTCVLQLIRLSTSCFSRGSTVHRCSIPGLDDSLARFFLFLFLRSPLETWDEKDTLAATYHEGITHLYPTFLPAGCACIILIKRLIYTFARSIL